ncbi:hypothetical protein FACS189491_02620 [Spirochaetia bacterium]|nr:hypothetical protein FACS189491_02620 [Spirochaetia bacterium]
MLNGVLFCGWLRVIIGWRSTEWSTMITQPKDFSFGSVGFYGSDKVTNPESAERYQCGLTFTLIGSKPGKYK